MKKDNLVYIEDILNACLTIEQYLNGVDFESFSGDKLRQDAVVRNIEIIGEAANKLTPEFSREHPDFPIKQAVGMRNKLIHDYREIEASVVWETAKADIPILKDVSQKILA